MATKIGYQDGISAGMNGLRDLDPSKTLLVKAGGKWPAIETLDDTPIDQWKAWDKLERTLTILAADHDKLLGVIPAPPNPNPPDPPTPPDPADSGYAPQSYNKSSKGDARYNIRVNCTGSGDDFTDGQGVHYDGAGLCKGAERSGQDVPGLKGSDMMDGKDPWEPYEWQGNTFPPYPAQSYER